MKIDIAALAKEAAARLRASPDKSKNSFFNITRQVVRGAGVVNESQLEARTREVRAEVRRLSALARSNRAQAKKAARTLGRKISP